MKHQFIMTTSWDDGDALDARLADLLSRYNVKGTFYITKDYRDKRLTEDEIREIAKVHEIGAHSLTHPDLRTLSPEEKEHEITGSKVWLEEILGTPVSMFCYPSGLYDNATVEVVEDAGFVGARTTRLGSISIPSDPFSMDTTLQVYPFPLRKKDAHHYHKRKLFQPLAQRARGLHSLGVPFTAMHSWLSTAKAAFDATRQRNGVFHLWGHSWEIDKYDMWDELEAFLAYVNKTSSCTHVVNSELYS